MQGFENHGISVMYLPGKLLVVSDHCWRNLAARVTILYRKLSFLAHLNNYAGVLLTVDTFRNIHASEHSNKNHKGGSQIPLALDTCFACLPRYCTKLNTDFHSTPYSDFLDFRLTNRSHTYYTISSQVEEVTFRDIDDALDLGIHIMHSFTLDGDWEINVEFSSKHNHWNRFFPPTLTFTETKEH